MKASIQTDHGEVVVDTDVIAKYAGAVAVECFGVVGMPAQNFSQFLRGEGSTRGIEVKIKDDGIRIAARIQVLYGTKISEIAKNISDAVLYAVEHTTGLTVESLDIKISGIRVVE